jgi:hypothetical protein
MGALDGVDLSRVSDPVAVQIIEALLADNRALRETVQQLRDEVARLKGEQGKPVVRAQARRRDVSSEGERPADPAPSGRGRPNRRLLLVVREVACPVDRASLPADAVLTGYQAHEVQEIVLYGEQVRYLRECWYAASSGRCYLGALPAGVQGHFGPQVKALALLLYHASGLSEPKILELLGAVGLQVSAGTLSGWLLGDVAGLHGEAAAVYQAGLASSPWQQMDDTLTRVNGENYHCQVVCNPLYTSYHTVAGKDRLSIVDVLRPGQEGIYLLNDLALDWLAAVGMSAGMRQQVVSALPRDTLLDQAGLRERLRTHLGHLGDQQHSRIYDALAIAAYQSQTTLPVVEMLVCDDAGQFVGVTVGRALCWVHDARHYKKLLPSSWDHQAVLAIFLALYWTFYRDLLAYRTKPSAADAARLRAAFDALFATITGYPALDERIAKTRAHRDDLLRVLDHPELPLHNNRSELAVRRRVRKRDVSFGPRTLAGAHAWDSLQTLAATAQIHGVNFLHYLQDRISGAYRLPSLATLISQRAPALRLDASWHPTPPTLALAS